MPGTAEITDTEQRLLRHLAADKAEMVYLIDITTALAGLPKTLQGDWFDEKLLSPNQKNDHRKVVKEMDAALRKLFAKGFVDIGREDICSEGLRRHHLEIVKSMRDGRYWAARGLVGDKKPSLRVIEDNVAHHETWISATDLRAAQREIGGKPELIGLTETGNALAEEMNRESEA
jgi:hypothetical protein